MNTQLHPDVQKLFEYYSATEVVETFEMLDITLIADGTKREFSREFEQRYEMTFYLLKRLIRALDPTFLPPILPSEN